MTSGEPQRGVLLRVDGSLFYVPSSVALRVARAPNATPVPGAPPDFVGIAMHEGAVLPVVAIGAARKEMIVCQHAGETIGIVGGEVLRTGSFDEHARLLDVATVYARAQSAARAGRWGV